jgi:ABC-type lipoprotein export system ATPase subunit
MLRGDLDQPDSGLLRVRGHHVAAMSEDEQDEYRLLDVGFNFQSFNLLASKAGDEIFQLLRELLAERETTHDRRFIRDEDLVIEFEDGQLIGAPAPAVMAE